MKNLIISIERLPLLSDVKKLSISVERLPLVRDVKKLRILVERLPDFNSNMPKTRKVVNAKRKSPRKPVPNKKYQQQNVYNKDVPPKKCYTEESNNERGLQKEKPQQNVKNTKNKKIEERQEFESKIKKNLLKSQSKESAPLVSRLRKFEDVNYFESSIEETPVKNIHINNGVKSKVPIYRQAFLVETKTNLKDPYDLDIDTEKEKRQKPKRNNSGKFDKTSYDILSNIRKKEKIAARKKRLVQKSPSKYDKHINKALNRVMMKVKAKKVVGENTDTQVVTKKAPEMLTLSLHQNKNKIVSQNELISEKTVFGNSVGHHSQEGFLGFNNNATNLSSDRLSMFSNVLQQNSQHCNLNTSQNISTITTNAVIEYHSTPKLKRSENSRINIVSDISIRNNMNSSLKKKFFTTDLIEESHNLREVFHNSSHLPNNQSVIDAHSDHTLQNDEQIYEHLGTDDYDTESELDEDEYFGFKESMGTSPVNVNFRRKCNLMRLPWRFQGYYRRNPHILKIKKNGLPCNQQEMVIDHEFVKRIENLSANNINKLPEPALPKPPVQTTMLHFVETTREHVEQPTRLSLFDYEDFEFAKLPRKPLMEIQPNQIVSTPRKVITSDLESPNMSIIPCNEENENLVPRYYNRKALEKKRDEQKEGRVDLLPPILNDQNDDVTDSDQHLFEDPEGEKNIDYSIKLPTIRYGNQKKRMRDGADKEKISKKKKKDTMTKTEEAEYEAWATKINKRFAEEDRHELTIE
ncbi:unnamed protein product [Psylliodes chrysocephalus]|uniref:Uncharacterized protein n=1 Tax=Psylliodes chrysocephalus TaxID=3402493 RepID=A0A9P0GCK9_9CUCU|nr:unnamed protein product [Psylliodes chrysocephala]